MARFFDFNQPIAHGDAIATIRAALDDEGLTLLDSTNATRGITTIRRGEIDRYIVPAWMIVESATRCSRCGRDGRHPGLAICASCAERLVGRAS